MKIDIKKFGTLYVRYFWVVFLIYSISLLVGIKLTNEKYWDIQTASAAQHDYDIANNPGAVVRSDINDALEAIATNNSAATEPASTYANQWWMDTSTNLLKQRDNANSAWVTVASKSGTTWIPYRAGSAIGTGALLTTDTDTSLAANSDSNVATQKAVKAYADGKISKTTAGELAAMTEKTTLVDDDIFLIEDSAASNAKKFVKKSNIITSTSGVEIFTEDGTFTVPSGITKVYVSMVGGGAGGGGGEQNHGGGGGGSSGNYVINYPVTVTPAGTVAITIGSAGTGGNGTGDGTDGGDTSFGALTVPGGNKGLGSGQTGGLADIGFDGSGNTSGGGENYTPGGNGADGASLGGKGGGNPWGIGGDGGSSGGGGPGDPGDNATGYGAGGGGADSNGGESASTGGTGSDGLVIVMY